MIVVPDKKKLVLNTDAAPAILQAIPHAKEVQHDGQRLIALNHGPEEAIVLRNLGIKVPAPIMSYYSWPARFPAMDHQKETAAFLSANKKALCLNAPGTGKTISSLWAADYLMEEGVVRKVLIVCPLSTTKIVWGREIMHHLTHRSFKLLVGSRQKRLEALETPGLQYAIINHDGFTTIADHLTGFDLVIYDEATALKTPGSVRYKVFAKWMQVHTPWLWLLTGTPISQNPTDAWTLARLVDSPTVPKSYTAFKDRVMQKVTTFKWVPRPDALDVCKQVLQPSIRYSLDECKDLPDTNYVGRLVEMTALQTKAFKDMQDKAIVAFSGGVVSADNAAVKLGKLVQICCGIVYGGDGEEFVVDGSLRYDGFKELIEEIGDKVIVFVPLRSVQEWLRDCLVKDGYDVAMVHGDTPKSERNDIFHNFQHTDTPKVLLAHPRTAAHGLTLTRAKDIIWYAPIYSLEHYEQACARIRRLSTEGKTTVWHLYATAFERELYHRLQHKRRVLADFLDLVKGVNDDEL